MRAFCAMIVAAGLAGGCSAPPTLQLCSRQCDDSETDGGPSEAPSDVFAFGGGKSIAVRWLPKSNPSAFDVYRDGKAVGHVTPGWHADFPEKDGNGFIDTGVSAGQTYKYSVKGLDRSGKVVWESDELTTTASTFTTEPTITVNARGDAELETWARDIGVPFFKIWYPKVVARFADPDYAAPSGFAIDFDPSYDGLAQAEDNKVIRISPKYVHDNQKDLGMLIHEGTHIVQLYADGAPGWFAEGMADWVREQMLHDRDAEAITGPLEPLSGYAPAAYALAWMESKYDPMFVVKWNKLAHTGSTPFSSMTFDDGKKSIIDVWGEIAGPAIPFGRVTGANSLCMGASGDRFNGPPITLSACNGSHQQRWALVQNKDDGTVSFVNALGECIDINNAWTANDTRVKLYGCSFNQAQRWKQQSDGTFVNPNSGRCLDAANGGASGAYLRLYDCSSGTNQRWTYTK